MKASNLALIVIDTLRLDEFEKLERRYGMIGSLGNATFLKNCIAPSPWTLPSHASIFTGLYPSEHGAHETSKIKSLDIDRIKLRMPTFVSDLNALGFHTYAISANPYVHPVYGFTDFDSFTEESYFTDIFGSVVEVSSKLKPLIAKYRNIYGNNVVRISSSILAKEPELLLEALASAAVHTPVAALKKIKAKVLDGWPIEKGGYRILRKIKETHFKTPYFIFVNLMEAHDPYVGKKNADFNWATPFLKEKPSQSKIAAWRKLYSKAALKGYKYAVEIAKNLLDRYGDNQLIIFTSDHGQALNEHGFIGHGTVLYDEVIKVPFAVVSRNQTGTHGSDGRYCSLANIKKFIFSYLNGSENAVSELYARKVYAQSFGIPANISFVPGIDASKMRKFDVKRVRRFFS
ncbi:MAG: sulfatase-like hydrolase/transferase [Candidatus Micrarchaeaceae archaeon]